MRLIHLGILLINVMPEMSDRLLFNAGYYSMKHRARISATENYPLVMCCNQHWPYVQRQAFHDIVKHIVRQLFGSQHGIVDVFYGRHKVLLAYLGNGIVNKYGKVLRPMSCSCTNPTVEFLWVFCAESRHPVTKAVISFYANDSMQHSVVGMKLHDIVRVCRQGRSAWGKVSKRRRGSKKKRKESNNKVTGRCGGMGS